MPTIEYDPNEVTSFTPAHAHRLDELEKEIAVLEAAVIAGDSGMEEQLAMELYGQLRSERQTLYLAYDLENRIRLTRDEVRATIDLRQKKMSITTDRKAYQHSITWNDLRRIAQEVLNYHDQLIEMLIDVDSFNEMRGKYFDETIQRYSDRKLRDIVKNQQSIAVGRRRPL